MCRCLVRPLSLSTHKRNRNRLEGHDLKTRIAEVLRHTAKNYTTPRAFLDNYGYFFYDQPLRNLDSENVPSETRETLLKHWPQLRPVNSVCQGIPPDEWTADELKARHISLVDGLCSKLEIPPKEMYKTIQLYLRCAIPGGGSGPSMHTTMAIFGRDVCMQRLNDFANLLDQESKEHVNRPGSLGH